jgi:hypothetical protein
VGPEFRESIRDAIKGYRELFGSRFNVDITVFYNRYTDLFSQDIIGAPFFEPVPAPAHLLLPAQFGNGLLGSTKGVEVAPEWRPLESVRLRGSCSFLRMDIEPGPGSIDVGSAPGIMGSSPRQTIVAQVSMNPSKWLDSMSTRGASARYRRRTSPRMPRRTRVSGGGSPVGWTRRSPAETCCNHPTSRPRANRARRYGFEEADTSI